MELGGRSYTERCDAQYQEKKNNGGLCRNFLGKGNLVRHGVTEAGMAAVGSSPAVRKEGLHVPLVLSASQSTAGAHTQWSEDGQSRRGAT